MVDLSSLDNLPAAPPVREEYVLTLEDLSGPPLWVQAFDPSLASTGYVEVERDHTGAIHVWRSETFRPKPHGLKSFEQDFHEAQQVEIWAVKIFINGPFSGGAIVHETPAVANAKSSRRNGPRVGLPGRLSAQAIRSAAHRMCPGTEIVMLNAQQSKKVICGNHKAEKKEAHDALKRATWIGGLDKVTNEHERDALLLALNLFSRRRG